jgi:hypothetical protein
MSGDEPASVGRSLAELSDDMYLRTLRGASTSLDALGSMASNRGDYELANKAWAMQAVVDRERARARGAGMRYLGSLPPVVPE